MAAQYTAGLSAGQVLTAATMNSIGAAWETWAPTYTATTGAFTTVTNLDAQYARIQKIVICRLSVDIASLGTASGRLQFTLPVNADTSQVCVGFWREYQLSGETGVVQLSSTSAAQLFRYDGGAYLTNLDKYSAVCVYEAS